MNNVGPLRKLFPGTVDSRLTQGPIAGIRVSSKETKFDGLAVWSDASDGAARRPSNSATTARPAHFINPLKECAAWQLGSGGKGKTNIVPEEVVHLHIDVHGRIRGCTYQMVTSTSLVAGYRGKCEQEGFKVTRFFAFNTALRIHYYERQR